MKTQNQIDAEINARREKIKQHEQLAELDRYISGKITHYVKDGYSGPQIFAKNETHCEYLDWKLNQYRDGSGGGWDRVYPCFSLEEAETKRLECFESKWKEWRSNKSASYVNYYFEAALKQGISIPEDIKNFIKGQKVEIAQKEVERTEKQIEFARLELKKAESL